MKWGHERGVRDGTGECEGCEGWRERVRGVAWESERGVRGGMGECKGCEGWHGRVRGV